MNEIIGHSILSFKTHQSFSTDLNVAKEFAGDDGMIIALKMNRHKFQRMCNTDQFCCGDVSWISKFQTEKQILVGKSSVLTINKNNIYNIGNYQYIICALDPLTQYDYDNQMSFENAFLKQCMCYTANQIFRICVWV